MKFECYYAERHKSLEFLTEPFAYNNIDHTLPYPILFNNNNILSKLTLFDAN